MNLIYGSWEGTTAMKLNYICSCFFGVCLVLSIPFIIGFYTYNFDKLDDPVFEKKWGAPYEGLKKDTKWSLLFPITFVVRRACFAYFCLFMPGFLIG